MPKSIILDRRAVEKIGEWFSLVVPGWGEIGMEMVEGRIRRLTLFSEEPGPWRDRPLPPTELVTQLEAYFRGEPVELRAPLDISALNPFDLAVLGEVRRIPRGGRRTYGDIARAIGRPGASRAVGGALRRNPIPLFIPCHRVVGKHSWGGFSAAGGTGLKMRLLNLEEAAFPWKGE